MSTMLSPLRNLGGRDNDNPLRGLTLAKVLAIKNWDLCLAVFGIPSTFFIGPPGTSTEKEEEYLQMAESLLADGRGYLPNGADVKCITGGTGRAHSTPFRAGTGYLYEGGRRVPLVVRWPGRVPAGRVVDAPVNSIDWIPALLELAGAPVPRLFRHPSRIRCIRRRPVGPGGSPGRPSAR